MRWKGTSGSCSQSESRSRCAGHYYAPAERTRRRPPTQSQDAQHPMVIRNQYPWATHDSTLPFGAQPFVIRVTVVDILWGEQATGRRLTLRAPWRSTNSSHRERGDHDPEPAVSLRHKRQEGAAKPDRRFQHRCRVFLDRLLVIGDFSTPTAFPKVRSDAFHARVRGSDDWPNRATPPVFLSGCITLNPASWRTPPGPGHKNETPTVRPGGLFPDRRRSGGHRMRSFGSN